MENTKEAGIELLLSQKHYPQVRGLKLLLRLGYFGHYRVTNGGTLWKIMHQTGRLPRSQSSQVELNELNEEMLAANDSYDNIQFINRLIDLNHFGDLTKIPNDDVFQKELARRGLPHQRYVNWKNYLRCSICSKEQNVLYYCAGCGDKTTLYCSAKCSNVYHA